MVFFLMAGCEWVNLGKRSESTDIAREGVMTCGSVMMGRVIVVTAVDVKSYGAISISLSTMGGMPTFFRRFVANMRTSVSGRKL